ncbi:MAG: L,D-transpeptidase [Anaerolineales bacterium]|nr:L,D-transpeptidase [Anaerolineales bacterium]
MKRLILQILLLSTVFLFSLTSQIIPVNAASNSSSDPSANPAVLCLPGIYINDPGDCTPAGPSTYLTQMAKIGITFPLTPLPASQADLSLAQMDIHYGEVKTENAPIYPSVEVALEKKKKLASERINASFAYISYDRSEEVDGGRFYYTGRGWMTAADVSRIGVLPRFQGLTFNRTPNNSFGWILTFLSATPVETKRTPGYQIADYTGHLLTEYEVVQIYDVATVDDSDWYMVGPDEWLPEKVVARVTPDTIPPEGVTGDRWIAINLDQQTIAVYEQRQLVFATVIASGSEPFWTQPGLFPIYEKLEKTSMRGAFEADGGGGYYLEDVPWTMYFDQARALHGAYWRTKMGFSQSHGCVNMTVGDAHWIFNWANIGDPVYIWDPSGQTPTDPSLYSSGGY